MSETRGSPGRIERAAPERNVDNSLQIAVHAGFVLCMVVFVILYARTYVSLASTWAATGTFQYAFLIFPITAVLVWSRREWLTRVAARPRPMALLGVAALGTLWLIGAAADVNLAMHIAVVVIWPVMVYLFYGPRVAGVLAFALGYLLFAIPFGDFLVGPLQTVTAHLSVFALRLTGVPVLMDGYMIDTPASAWHVAEACSGVKFFVATAAFGVLYAYLFFTGLRRRLIFIVIALVVPIVANGLRVYFTILIGEYIGMKYATGTDHLIFGWQFFGIVLFVLFICGWPWHQPPAAGPIPDQGRPEEGSRRVLWVAPAALLLIMLPASWYAVTGLLSASTDRSASYALPAQLAGYSALSNDYNGDSLPPLQGLDVHITRRYGDDEHPVRVDYLGVDAGSDGPDIRDIRNTLYDTGRWRPISGPAVVRAAANGPEFAALRLSAVHGRRHRELLYAYRIGARWTTSPLRFKIWQSVERLTGQPASAGILVVSGEGRPGLSELASVATAAARSLRRSG